MDGGTQKISGRSIRRHASGKQAPLTVARRVNQKPPRGERKHANKGLMGKRWRKRRRRKRLKGTLSLRERYLDCLKEIRGKLSRISAHRLGILARL